MCRTKVTLIAGACISVRPVKEWKRFYFLIGRNSRYPGIAVMAIFSKPVRIHCSCYELGHCWTPHCVQATTDVAQDIFSEAIKIYAALYLVSFSGLEVQRKKLPTKQTEGPMSNFCLHVVNNVRQLVCLQQIMKY